MKLNKILGGINILTKDDHKVRSSNLELYRIIVMFLIVCHHYVVNSGLMNEMNENPLSVNTTFFSLFGAWGKTGINCFVMITGWFMCKSEISLRKFLKLILQVLTYSIGITSIFLACGYHSLGIAKMLYQMIPLMNIDNGFVNCFLVFYLFIPFLNILLRNLNKQQHQLLLVLLLFIYVLHGSVPKLMHVSMNYVSWFSTLYFVAAYLRFYPIKDGNARFWGLMTAVSWGLSVISIVLLSYLQAKFSRNTNIAISYSFISDSNAILAFTNGITSFMWFNNLKIKNSKFINAIAASSFGVFLIHTRGDIMRHWLWKDTIDCIGHYDTSYYWLYAIGCVLAIYVVCTIIDYIRIRTIETTLLNATEKACYWVEAKFNGNN